MKTREEFFEKSMRTLELPLILQIPDVLLGAGFRYTPLVFLLRAVFLFDEYFMSAVRTDGLFPVR